MAGDVAAPTDGVVGRRVRRTVATVATRPDQQSRAPRPSAARDAANHSSGAGPAESVSRPARSMWWVSV
jgi:hypothetical protein